MLGTFQRHFPKRQFPKDIFPSGNFPNVQFPKRQLRKSVLVAALGQQPVLTAALGPLARPRRIARPHFSLRRLRSCRLRNSTFGKFPLGKFILGKTPFGKYLNPTVILQITAVSTESLV